MNDERRSRSALVRRWLLAASAVGALAITAPAGAVGLGNAEVRSALNQRLDVHIPVTGLRGDELQSLRVQLGSDEAFARAGLDRAAVPPELRLELHSTGPRRGFVRIRTRGAVREPHVGLVVELSGTDRVVRRSYDLLLGFPP